MDLDSVAAEVVYPTVGFVLYNVVRDGELLSACFRAYNDWIAEFCNAHPQRLKGVALINLDDVQDGVAERRGAAARAGGALIPAYPWLERPYSSGIHPLLGGGARPGHALRAAYRDESPRTRPAPRVPGCRHLIAGISDQYGSLGAYVTG